MFRASNRRRGEEGATLLLALIFVLLVSVIMLAIVNLSGTNILNTANLQNERTLEYSAEGAVQTTIQAVRYLTPAATATTPCSTSSGYQPPGPLNATDGAVVYCQVGTLVYARALTFEACPTGTSANACTNNVNGADVLKATILFDDVSTNCSDPWAPGATTLALAGGPLPDPRSPWRIGSWSAPTGNAGHLRLRRLGEGYAPRQRSCGDPGLEGPLAVVSMRSMHRGARLPYETLAGVVPCPAGWLAASAKLQGITIAPEEAQVFGSIRDALDYKPAFQVLALFTPVGLLDTPVRKGRHCGSRRSSAAGISEGERHRVSPGPHGADGQDLHRSGRRQRRQIERRGLESPQAHGRGRHGDGSLLAADRVRGTPRAEFLPAQRRSSLALLETDEGGS